MTRGSFVTPSIQRLWSRPLRWVQRKHCRLSVLAGRELCSNVSCIEAKNQHGNKNCKIFWRKGGGGPSNPGPYISSLSVNVKHEVSILVWSKNVLGNAKLRGCRLVPGLPWLGIYSNTYCCTPFSVLIFPFQG